jgi:putative ABC transport system permease protein
MDRAALGRLARDGDLASGAYLSLERGAEGRAYAALKRIPAVAGVSSRAAMIEQFDLQMARSMAVTRLIVVIAATALTLGVVYNGARIALSERGRELASLRVLGFTRREVAALLLGEQAATALAAIPLGCLAGWGFSALLIRAFQQERQQFPLVIRAHGFAWSALAIVVATVLAGLAMRRRVYRLDLIGVLKTRE